MRNSFIYLTVLIGCIGIANASKLTLKQQHISSNRDLNRLSSDANHSNFLTSGYAIGLNFGTIGPGVSINKKISNHFSFRLAYQYGSLNQQLKTTFQSDPVSIDAAIKLGAYTLHLDYFPSVKSSFHISTGVAYNQNQYNIDITPTNNQNYGLITYTPAQVGSIQFNITGANYAPYLGLGFGRTIPKHRFGFGFDLGAFYHGTPKTVLNCTGTFEPSNTPENQKIVQKAFEDFSFYPFLNFKLTFKIVD